MSASRSVILFLTDKASPRVLEHYDTLTEDVGKHLDTFLLFHQHGRNDLPVEVRTRKHYSFTYRSLLRLNYQAILETLIPGSNHFPVLQFFLEYPDYDHYWCVEDDVFFTGDWNFLISSFEAEDHDFISTHIRFFNDEPNWFWWNSLCHARKTIEQHEKIRSFNPIYRISRAALHFIHTSLRNGWKGHHEVLIPTLLYHEKFKVLDFGGNGRLVQSVNMNRFYTSGSDAHGELSVGTMRFRPVWKAVGSQENKLYHPVKVSSMT